MTPWFQCEHYALYHGDCVAVLKTMPDNSADSFVTDPPYGIRFMGKAWDGKDITRRFNEANTKKSAREKTGRAAAAGKYDLRSQASQAFQKWTETWAREALRVLKPGGFLVSFSSTRTYHRMTCGIEDAGFEIRDQLAWVFGSGFPKSFDVAKALDRKEGMERPVIGSRSVIPGVAFEQSTPYATGRTEIPITASASASASASAKEFDGWGTALKPAWEPIVLARKPLDGTVAENFAKWGVGGLNIDACRVEGEKGGGNWTGRDVTGIPGRLYEGGFKPNGHNGENSLGRWPANLCHDGSEEVVEMFPQSSGAQGEVTGEEPSAAADGTRCFGRFGRTNNSIPRGDEGSAARFFYCAKSSTEDREEGLEGIPQGPLAYGNQAQAEVKRGNVDHAGSSGINSVKMSANIHPTVKPTELMRWLARLVTPSGGLVIDPFTGSGSTGKACVLEGFRFIGMDLDDDGTYLPIAKARIEYALTHRDRWEQIHAAPSPTPDAVGQTTLAL